MIKIIDPDSQQLGENVPRLVKLSNRGLHGNDLRALIKLAGHWIVGEMKKTAMAPGEVPIHLIAIGAGERYLSNRNGDRFLEKVCRDYHHTFVTKPVTKEGAYWYRNHSNKDPLKSYGIVKASYFNDDMKRIELLVALNGTKEAAERNGGLVAEEELQKLASDIPIAVSMACRVGFDKCSGCGHESRTRDEYCDESTCPYGGLKNNMSKVANDGHVLCADNPHPSFFDISNVGRPADRIAYVLGEVVR